MISSLFSGKRSQKATERKNPLGKLLGSDTVKSIVINEKDRKRRSRQRWDLRISASDPEFLKVESDFERALAVVNPDQSIQGVLDRHFTAFEKKLLTPVDKRRHPQLYKIQRLNRKRFLRLLKSPRFESRKSTASLAFKLTLLYFGLPVAPMGFGIGINDSIENEEQLELDVSDDHDDAPMDLVAEELRPLRFLNAYQNRMWGADSLRDGAEDLEVYYSGPRFKPSSFTRKFGTTKSMREALNLRGGGLVEEDADMAAVEDEAPPDENQLTLRGGAGNETTAPMILYGLQGQTQFDMTIPRDFFAAVNRLLGLTDRNVAVSFALWDKKARIWSSELSSLQLGDKQSELAYYGNLYDFISSDEYDNENNALFVWTWGSDVQKYLDSVEPDPKRHRVARFTLKDSHFHDVAYLSIPESHEVHAGANYYEDWFKAILRILCRIGDGEIGDKSVSPYLSNFVRLVHQNNPNTSYGTTSWPRFVWENVHGMWVEVSITDFQIEILPGVLSEGEMSFQVYGYNKSCLGPGRPLQGREPRAFVELVEESLPVSEWNIANVVEIHGYKEGQRHKTGFHTLHLRNGEDAKSFDELKKTMQGSSLLTGRALWDDYEAVAPKPPNHFFQFRLDDTWQSFEDRVDSQIVKKNPKLAHLQRGDYGIQLDERDAYDEMGSINRIAYDFFTEKQGTNTGENDLLWSRFTKRISRSKVYVEIFEVAKHPARLREANPSQCIFGYQDPYRERPRFSVLSTVEVEPTPDPPKDTDKGDDSDDEPPPLPSIEEALALNKPVGGTSSSNTTVPVPSVPVTTTPITGEKQPLSQQTPLPESEEDKASRIKAFEAPAQRKPYDENPPPRLAAMSEFERGRLAREWSYGRPLSVNAEGLPPTFPINAPPVEHIIRTNSSSMPAVAAQLLTASEQRRLQGNLFEMRQIALQRTQKCPYDSCEIYFPLAENWRLQGHLKKHHTGKECPFCPEILYEHWSPAQQRKHFEEKHADHFSQKGDLARDSSIQVKDLERVHPREQQYNFCPRCGRNHHTLDSKADRTQHDNHCFPGMSITFKPHTWCVDCGEAIDKNPHSAGLSGNAPDAHVCTMDKSQAAGKAEHPYCEQCGLACGLFSRRYASKHLHHCKGHGAELTKFCPWCGVDMGLDSNVRLAHLAGCSKCPNGAEGPIDISTGDPTPSPLLNEEILRKRFFASKPGTVEIPKKCPFNDCQTDMSFLNANGIFRHFLDKHGDVLGNVDTCPYCELDFEKRGWKTRVDKVAHFDDHLSKYRSRIAADRTISTLSELDPLVIAARRNRDADIVDPFAEQTGLEGNYAASRVELHAALNDLNQVTEELNALKKKLSSGANKSSKEKEKEKLEQEKKKQQKEKEKQEQEKKKKQEQEKKKKEQEEKEKKKQEEKKKESQKQKQEQEEKDKEKKEQEKKDESNSSTTGKDPAGPKTPPPKPPGSVKITPKETPSTPKPKPKPGKKPPAKPSRKRKFDDDGTFKPGENEAESEDELAGPPSQKPKEGSNGKKPAPKPPAAGEKDPTFKPARRLSDGDDDYTEGLVPEPKPDIELEPPEAPPSHKRPRMEPKPPAKPAKPAQEKPAKPATKPPAATSGRVTRSAVKKQREDAEKAKKAP